MMPTPILPSRLIRLCSLYWHRTDIASYRMGWPPLKTGLSPVKVSRSSKEPIPPDAALPGGRDIVRRHSTSAPAHASGDHTLELRLVVAGKVQVARAEVHGASCPSAGATTTATD